MVACKGRYASTENKEYIYIMLAKLTIKDCLKQDNVDEHVIMEILV